MALNQDSEISPVALESIICTDELDSRPSRPPDHQTENCALLALAQALADSPRTILQTLADTILTVFRADSAGVSLLTKDERRFYWPAIAGVWKPHLGGGTPRDFGPCGDVLDRNCTLMMKHVERRYDYFQTVTPLIEECLLVPFYVAGKAVGTIWAIAHDQRRKFDAEDRRQLASLGRFASSAYQVVESLSLLEKQVDAVRESEERFHTLADHMSQLAWMADAKGGIYWYNQRWFDYTGATLDDMQGWGWTKVHHPDHIDRVVTRIQRSWDTGESWEDTFPLRGKDGEYRWFLSRAVPIRDATGNILRWFGTNTDVTDQRATEEALDIAREAAEAANRAKDRFLAVLSHELRTPLAPVLMTVAAMDMNPDFAPAIRNDVAMIRRNVELEARLIDDLLDLSRVTAGKLLLNLEAVDVNSAMRHVCETCRPFILEKGIHLHDDLPGHACHVKADPTRLQQVLWNLLKNAAKFTPERGDIYVSISAVDGDRIWIQVRDTGIGIAPEILPKIFEAFEQGDDNVTRKFGGMGLGLAISKALVEMHGGAIRAESGGKQRGSTFTVELPSMSTKDRAHTAPAECSAGSGDLRVLVVEDDADTALVLSRLLGTSGHKVKTAGSAAAALELAGVADNTGEPFDVMVSDIGLPDKTGYELMQAIKSRHSMKGIAMTGYGMDEDLRKSREAGFSDHVVKPPDFVQLERMIRRVAAQGSPIDGHSAEGSRHESRP
jgi:PAS domain S-box-containing protein